VTKRQPTAVEIEALEFAWRSVKYVKSNGIIITNNHQTLGVGPGQTNRVASVKIAIEQAADRLDGAVLASDAFFPLQIMSKKLPKQESKRLSNPVVRYVIKMRLTRQINTVLPWSSREHGISVIKIILIRLKRLNFSIKYRQSIVWLLS
jgi:hypothetical protein